MPRFGGGQFVELYPRIRGQQGGSTPGATRGIVQIVDLEHADEAIYLIAFLQSERLDGRRAWLREIDLFPASSALHAAAKPSLSAFDTQRLSDEMSLSPWAPAFCPGQPFAAKVAAKVAAPRGTGCGTQYTSVQRCAPLGFTAGAFGAEPLAGPRGTACGTQYTSVQRCAPLGFTAGAFGAEPLAGPRGTACGTQYTSVQRCAPLGRTAGALGAEPLARPRGDAA
jgi:hypothetical protein